MNKIYALYMNRNDGIFCYVMAHVFQGKIAIHVKRKVRVIRRRFLYESGNSFSEIAHFH